MEYLTQILWLSMYQKNCSLKHENSCFFGVTFEFPTPCSDFLLCFLS